MSLFDVQVITDKEAAAILRLPLRQVRKAVDTYGLCMKTGRSRRLTETQFAALQQALTVACRSSSTAGRLATGTSAGRSKVSSTTRALELATALKQKRSART